MGERSLSLLVMGDRLAPVSLLGIPMCLLLETELRPSGPCRTVNSLTFSGPWGPSIQIQLKLIEFIYSRNLLIPCMS